jgi:hypothetical protein
VLSAVMKQKNHTQLSRYASNCCQGLQTLHFEQVVMSLTTVYGPDMWWKPIKIVSGAFQYIPDFITKASLKNMFCDKSTGWSKKVSPIEIFTSHPLPGCCCTKRSQKIVIQKSYGRSCVCSKTFARNCIYMFYPFFYTKKRCETELVYVLNCDKSILFLSVFSVI